MVAVPAPLFENILISPTSDPAPKLIAIATPELAII